LKLYSIWTPFSLIVGSLMDYLNVQIFTFVNTREMNSFCKTILLNLMYVMHLSTSSPSPSKKLKLQLFVQ